jgi:hypothetical protein
MASIRDVFTFYLKAEHLQGRTVVAHIESCTIAQVFNPRAKHNEPHLIIRFHGKKLALACNKTQASALERITGTDDYTRWPGHAVTLSPGKAATGADTILITAAPIGGNPLGAPQGAATNGNLTPPNEAEERENTLPIEDV